ncbi:MAG: hypothetical protein EBX40_06390, partial [Gammaproteobacteria bacterium]|nr:hypothetical protein [Gammaproteobacteria bacterium]
MEAKQILFEVKFNPEEVATQAANLTTTIKGLKEQLKDVDKSTPEYQKQVATIKALENQYRVLNNQLVKTV